MVDGGVRVSLVEKEGTQQRLEKVEEPATCFLEEEHSRQREEPVGCCRHFQKVSWLEGKEQRGGVGGDSRQGTGSMGPPRKMAAFMPENGDPGGFSAGEERQPDTFAWMALAGGLVHVYKWVPESHGASL